MAKPRLELGSCLPESRALTPCSISQMYNTSKVYNLILKYKTTYSEELRWTDFIQSIKLHVKLHCALPQFSITVMTNNLYTAWIMHFCDFYLIKTQQDGSTKFYKYTLISSLTLTSYLIHFLPYQSQNSSHHYFFLAVQHSCV